MNKRKTFLLSIIVLLSLMMLSASISFAYFIFNFGGDSSFGTVTTARLGKVEYVIDSPEETGVFPGWEGNGSTKVYFISDSDVAVDYTCTLEIEEGSYANNIYVQTTNGLDGNILSETPIPSVVGEELIISKGTLAPESGITDKGEIHEVDYKLIFKETGERQNIDQGRLIKTHVKCFLDKTEFEENKKTVTLNVEGATPDAGTKYVHIGGSETFTLTPDIGYDIDTAEVINEEEIDGRGKNSPIAFDIKKYTISALKFMADDEEDKEEEETDEDSLHCRLYVDENDNLKVLASNIEKNTICTIKLDKEKYYFYFTSDEAENGFESLYEVEYGEEVSRVIEPKDGYVLEGATTEGYETCDISGDIVSATVVRNGRCKVDLKKQYYSVNVNITEENKTYGEVFKYTITPTEGYTTVGAYYNANGCLLEEDQLTVTIKNDVSCNILLPKAPTEPRSKYTVTVLCSNCTSNFGQKGIYEGNKATFVISPNDGYTLRNAKVSSSNDLICSLNNNDELIVNNVTEDTTCTVEAKVKSHILSEKILDDNKIINASNIDYNLVDKGNNTGEIFFTTDTLDNSRVFFYRGSVTNNWVVFGENASGEELYWRIIRTNTNSEGNGVRLLYVGTSTKTTNASIVSNSFNPRYYPSQVGYMYGNSYDTLSDLRANQNDSEAKRLIDNWYSRNLIKFNSYINKSAIYCGDTSMEDESDYVIRETNNKLKGNVYMGSYERLKADDPSYKCENTVDRYSVRNGNKALTYPIALITADEIVFAGGSSGKSNSKAWYYLNSSGESINGKTKWWTMSPAKLSTSATAGVYGYPYVYTVNGKTGTYGSVSAVTAEKSYAIRPVISLNNDVLTNDGVGTASNPYRILPYENVKVSVICENCKESNITFEIEKHSDKVLTITPKDGYMLRHASVSGERCSIKGNTLTVENAYNGQTCIVELAPLAYEVKFIADNGTVSLSYTEVLPGGRTETAITPREGYDINTLSTTSSGCIVEGNKLVATNVGKDRSCVGTLSKLKYTVGLTVDNGTPETASQIVEHSSNATFTLVANDNYDINRATVTGGCTLSGSTLTASNVTENMSCYVNIPLKQYNVGVSCSGCTSNPASTIVDHGSNASFTITASNGYSISTATTSTEGCQVSGSGDTRIVTVSNVTSAKTCAVSLTKNTYTVSVSCSHCSSSPSSKDIEYEGSGTFTISASSGYKLSGATVSGTGCSLSGSTLTVSNVTSTRTCSISAKKNSCTIKKSATNGYSASSNYYAEWTATYECNGSTGTIIACHYSGKKGEYDCTGGTSNTSSKPKTYMCYATTSTGLKNYCNSSAGAGGVTGGGKGGLTQTISCSCP